MDIAEFLTAQYDEDEAVAQQLAEHGNHDAIVLELLGGAPAEVGAPYRVSLSSLRFLATLGPARVLADIAAKRRILARHADPHHYCDDSSGKEVTWYISGEPVRHIVACDTLCDLAEPFKEHPDFDDFTLAWAVEA